MFSNCKELTSLDVSHFDTSNAITMNSLFNNCQKLTSLDLSNFDTSKVTDMKSMFQNCLSLTSINLSSFNTYKCNDFSNMFYNCQNLTYINFNNFYETNITLFDNFIYGTNAELLLCFNIRNDSRLYQELKNKFIEECLKKEEIVTTDIIITNTTYINIAATIIGESTEYNQLMLSSNTLKYDISSNIIDNSYTSDEYIYINSSSNLIITQKINYISTEISLNDFPNDNNTDLYNKIIDQIIHNFQIGVIEGNDNYIFEITTEEEQQKALNGLPENSHNLTIIDLGNCKNLLLENYFNNETLNISLIILKYEKIANISNARNIQYEVFEPINKTKLNLSICNKEMINIYIPLQLSESIEDLIQELNILGYDIFNIQDAFYQDICTKYTSKGGTDISLEDRKKYIYEKIMTELDCPNDCQFSDYSIEKKNLKCACVPSENIDTVTNEKFSANKLYQSFYDVLKYSNYKIVKCYKLVFDKNNFKINKGFIISFVFFCLNIVTLIIYVIKRISPLKENIAKYQNNKNSILETENMIKILNPKKLGKILNKNFQAKNNNINIPPKKRPEIKNIINIRQNVIKLQAIIKPTSRNYEPKPKNKKYSKEKQIELNTKIKPFNSSKNVLVLNKEKKSPLKHNKDFTQNKKEIYDDFELNNLGYEDAIIHDNRNFCKIYWSILRREHLFIFTFLIYNDYNFYYVKFTRFLFLLTTDMALNVFFFSDESMHKLYLSYGEYDFVQQIPQMFYSKLVSNLIEVFLCYLSLTDKPFYLIKEKLKKQDTKIFYIIRCVDYKLFIFYLFTFLLFLCYIYLITAFCAVYENTQIVYIKDSFFTFLLGFVNQLVLYFFSSLLRFISLKSKNRKVKWLYKISDIIPIF